jgi:ABC-2 type transport system permease protein
VLGSLLRNLFDTALVVLVALAVGFRPTADPVRWLAVVGLVTLLLFAIAWVAAAIGLVTGNATGAASVAAIFQILPFLSGAFVPTDTMPGWLQAFTANQPMTYIVATLRGLLTGTPVGNHGWLAVAWCAGAAAVGYLWPAGAYNRQGTR